MPALPTRKDTTRQRAPETPSHPGGISSAARAKLEERRRIRDLPSSSSEAVVSADTRNAGPSREQGLGDFKNRSNKGFNREDEQRRDMGPPRGGGYQAGRMGPPQGGSGVIRREGQAQGKSWNDAPTPRTDRTSRENDGGSMRLPNRGWDETPRTDRGGSGRAGNGGWTGATPRGGPARIWDAATPRTVRGSQAGSPEADGEDGMQLDAREWEEEQVKLDRDWYSYEEGGVAGDEDHNPFAGFEDMGREKEEEMQAKQVKKLTARQAHFVSHVKGLGSA